VRMRDEWDVRRDSGPDRGEWQSGGAQGEPYRSGDHQKDKRHR